MPLLACCTWGYFRVVDPVHDIFRKGIQGWWLVVVPSLVGNSQVKLFHPCLKPWGRVVIYKCIDIKVKATTSLFDLLER